MDLSVNRELTLFSYSYTYICIIHSTHTTYLTTCKYYVLLKLLLELLDFRAWLPLPHNTTTRTSRPSTSTVAPYNGTLATHSTLHRRRYTCHYPHYPLQQPHYLLLSTKSRSDRAWPPTHRKSQFFWQCDANPFTNWIWVSEYRSSNSYELISPIIVSKKNIHCMSVAKLRRTTRKSIVPIYALEGSDTINCMYEKYKLYAICTCFWHDHQGSMSVSTHINYMFLIRPSIRIYAFVLVRLSRFYLWV